MKKAFFIILIIGFICSLPAFSFASGLFNADGPSAGATGATGVLTSFKTSKSVSLYVNSGPNSFAAVASHTNGDKVYGGASNDSKIYWTTKTAGTAYTTAPNASDSSAVSSWSAL